VPPVFIGKMMNQILSNVRCTHCGSNELSLSDFKSRGAVLCSACTRVLGTFLENENRIEWHLNSADRDLENRVTQEQDSYDYWATQQMQKTGFQTSSEFLGSVSGKPAIEKWYDFPLYQDKATRLALERFPELKNLSGKHILDVGGSCKDSWRFIGAGAKRIDQVEVSPESQRLAIERLDKHLSALDVKWQDKAWFHTTPAERLPFCNKTFDIVFSRATIHHTKRPDSFHEIHRVLKQGSLMFIIELRLSFPMYYLQKLSRRLRRVDRGTDDPLRSFEILALREFFREVDWYISGFISTLWKQSLGKAISSSFVDSRLEELEKKVGNLFGLSYLLGNKCWVIARK